ncbi:MAG: hypothetical protein SP1CHLAM54_00950 [Chlamydiia bacterium]|nr:hypothetical protein [Chlamydiia bacterium]MCH9615017.1 hypothetical protein [Chlamydiia bacterium]MCH9629932.1 hypothetical protein [Chlamydiia bacterium]
MIRIFNVHANKPVGFDPAAYPEVSYSPPSAAYPNGRISMTVSGSQRRTTSTRDVSVLAVFNRAMNSVSDAALRCAFTATVVNPYFYHNDLDMELPRITFLRGVYAGPIEVDTLIL